MRIAKILPDSIEVEDSGELVLRFSLNLTSAQIDALFIAAAKL